MPLHNLLLLGYKMIFRKLIIIKITRNKYFVTIQNDMYNVLYQLSKRNKRCILESS